MAKDGIRHLLLGSVRKRLLILALAPVLLIIPMVLLMAYLWSTQVDYRQLLMKANTDLAVAEESLLNTQQHYSLQLAVMVESLSLRQQVAGKADAVAPKYDLPTQIEQLRIETDLDYIRLLDPNGCDWFRPQDCSYPASRLLDEAAEGKPQSGMEVFSAAQLLRLDPWLAEQARLPLIDTEYAKPTQRQEEERGMILHLVYPLQDSSGELRALLVGGVLMNRNLIFVDLIQDTVYGEGSLLAGSLGTVTLFLDDVRISTNVPAKNDVNLRALGTRVSAQVREKVLERGEVWLDRAFVVSEWYVSGYSPLLDVNNQRIGMLYAGFSEAPYKQAFYAWMQWLLLFFIMALIVSGLWAIVSARAIFRPIESMVAVIGCIRQGERIRMSEAYATDELRVLSEEFNQLLVQLEAQHDHIQQAADKLELKVAERTEELQQNLKLLQRTREQLVEKGKLAAIGELAAGIAHEINNPTQVILGYLDLMMQELGERGAPVQAEARLIVEQVERIRAIINNLLQYARSEDSRQPLEAVDLNRVIVETQPLVKHDLARHQVQLQLDLRAQQPIHASRHLLQQVLINLIVNAVNAMPAGGRLTLRSRDWRDSHVLLVVRDNGCGMTPDILSRIFDPFYSASRDGTGLGLSVTFSILQRFQAEVEVRSRPDVGTSFFIWIPLD